MALSISITRYQLSGGINLNDDQWHHVAIAWNGATGLAYLYHGGILSRQGKSSLLRDTIAGQGILVIGNNTNRGTELIDCIC